MVEPRFPPVQGRQQMPPPAKKQGISVPVLPLVLLLLYVVYVGVMIIAPILVSSFKDTIDGVLEFNIRVAIGGILLLVFIAIMVLNLLDSGKTKTPPSRKPAPPPGARPPPRTNRFKPVQPASVEPSPPQTSSVNVSQVKEAPSGEAARRPVVDGKTQAKEPTVISYPTEVEGGFYGATFIEISSSKVLKLRSLVVEPEYL